MEKSDKTSRVVLSGIIFAITFFLTTKALNIFVFGNLAYSLLYSALLGFVTAGEIGFFIVNKEVWLEEHKKTANLFGDFFKRNYRKILNCICFLGSVILVITINVLYFKGKGLGILAIFESFDIKSELETSCLIVACLLSLGAIFAFIAILADETDKLKNGIILSGAYLAVGILSPLLIFLVCCIIHLYIFQFIEILFLQFLAIFLFLTVLRLATISEIASVAIGGTLGGFCGYLMPGWEQMILLPTFEAACVAGVIGAVTAYFAHKLGKLQTVILIHRLMLANKIK